MIVFDKMQHGYQYDYAAPMGEAFASEFKPDFTPKQMLQLGVFEGHYLNDCQNEFPADWFDGAKISLNKPDVSLNYFKIKARMSLLDWQKRGWILEPDPRGWFQWYCRYYMGRRMEKIDAWQIRRWRAFYRHAMQIKKNCFALDLDCRKKQLQALLQWAYDPFF